jgi:hypothetical protein
VVQCELVGQLCTLSPQKLLVGSAVGDSVTSKKLQSLPELVNVIGDCIALQMDSESQSPPLQK